MDDPVVVEYDFEHMHKWYKTKYALPEDGIVVLARLSDGSQQLVRDNNEWVTPDRCSSPYEEPSKWSYL